MPLVLHLLREFAMSKRANLWTKHFLGTLLEPVDVEDDSRFLPAV